MVTEPLNTSGRYVGTVFVVFEGWEAKIAEGNFTVE